MSNFQIKEISEIENGLISDAEKNYGEYFRHAQFAVNFLSSFIKDTSQQGAFFLLFLTLIYKHIILSILSGIRRHHIQANFDLRYATEAGAWAVYAMANPNSNLLAKKKDGDLLEPDSKLKEKMYKWLEDNYPVGSVSLKRFKGLTNKLSTHSNIIDAYRNYDDFSSNNLKTLFFDVNEEHIIKTDLWSSANLTMGLLDLFYGVNRDYKVLTLQDDFISRMKTLVEENKRLKEEMSNHPRIKRFIKNDNN